jgi:MFS family permease
VVWVLVELRTDEPLADIRSLARPPVLYTNIATLLVGFGMFGSFVLTPQIAQAPTSTGYGFGLDATGAGLLLLPGSLLMLVLGPMSGVLGQRYGNKVPLTLGAAITTVGLALLAVDHGSKAAILGFSVVMTAGIAFAYAAMPNLIVEAVPRTETGQATGFNAVVRMVGSSLGTQVTAAIVAAGAGAGKLPSGGAYGRAFAAGAGGALIAALVSARIPRARSGIRVGAIEELGNAVPLAEPAYVEERR